MRFMAWLGSP